MGDGSCAFQIIRSRVHTTCTRDVCIMLGHVTDKDECVGAIEYTRCLSRKIFLRSRYLSTYESMGIAFVHVVLIDK